MSKLLFFMAILISNIAFCQQSKQNKITKSEHAIKFNECNLNPFVIDDGTFNVMLKSSETIEQYVSNKISKNKKHLKTGEILVQLIIDTLGKICCKSISSPSLSGNELYKINLHHIIDSMPPCNIVYMDGEKWNCSVLLNISVRSDKTFKVVKSYSQSVVK